MRELKKDCKEDPVNKDDGVTGAVVGSVVAKESGGSEKKEGAMDASVHPMESKEAGENDANKATGDGYGKTGSSRGSVSAPRTGKDESSPPSGSGNIDMAPAGEEKTLSPSLDGKDVAMTEVSPLQQEESVGLLLLQPLPHWLA